MSGGPSSVYQKNALTVDKKIFFLGIPILGICYGLQLTAYLLGGQVLAGEKKEYGPKKIKIRTSTNKVLENIPKEFRVWMSHGDEVKKLPVGFSVIGSTDNVFNAFVADEKRKIYGFQFHPEVAHTQFGKQILKNFLKNICIETLKRRNISPAKTIEEIRKTVKGKEVIGAVSGGVDSTVAAFLTIKAVGKQFHPFFVEMGLERLGTKEMVIKIFQEVLGIKVKIIQAKDLFLKKLKGVINPEEKRKIIGQLYAEIFQKEVKKIKNANFLLQGTIYSDVIESKGSRHAEKIKSHHNVAGLPEKLDLQLLEPLRFFYKDEVIKLGLKLASQRNCF